MELLSQPFNGQLGNRLMELLNSQDYQTLNIIVAFAKNSGVLRIKDELEKFRKRGGRVNVYVGVDLEGTSYEALTALLVHVDSLCVVHSETGQTFHTKIYNFVGNEEDLVIVGSHNLTGGGLWTNFESSVIIPIRKPVENDLGWQDSIEKYISELASLGESFMPIETQDDIEKLLDNGYVVKEVSERIHRAQNITFEIKREPMFGTGAPAKLPSITVPVEAPSSTPLAEAIALPESEVGKTVWFETRRMTGGSRNILDLSKRSLVIHGNPKDTPYEHEDPGFMRGGVEFFGVDPTDETAVKNITINFEGIDYTGNTILFGTGNGTWRLQIRGHTDSGEKITDALKAKDEGDYLVDKIVAFTEVQDDYYFMSVFPETELPRFKDASVILAHNGSTGSSKLLGLL